MVKDSVLGSNIIIKVREFDIAKDCRGVEDVERECEVGPSGKLSLFTDLLGDPLCRIRNSPAYTMLVAEMVVEDGKDGKDEKDGKGEIVGMIRGCIKMVTCGEEPGQTAKGSYISGLRVSPSHRCIKIVTCGEKPAQPLPLYAKVAYILGLRVSPLHRRMGIGAELVAKIEEWFNENGAEYSYMATENDNEASVKLFTDKCGYSKFRTPSILVQPVFAHRVKVSSRVTIIKLSPSDAEILYRDRFATTEFFPSDIDSILNNKLNLGTYLAVPYGAHATESWPESWAVLSVWNCKDVFKLEVRGASRLRKLFAKTTRVLDRALPWLQLPSVPEFFKPFGFHFLYGLGGEGLHKVKLMKALCKYSHNLAKEHGCGVVATEIASLEPLRFAIPHWNRLSCPEDLWCLKRLAKDNNNESVNDWTRSAPGTSIFVDPREF